MVAASWDCEICSMDLPVDFGMAHQKVNER